MTIMTPLRTLLSLERTLRKSWAAEPVAVLVNLERRRGNSCSAAIIDLVHRNTEKIPGRVLVCLAALLAEDQSKLENLLLSATNANKLRPREAKILADIAITAGRQDLAKKFEQSMPGATVGYRITRAKLLWYNGEMTRAIEELSQNHPRERRLREIYEAEKEVFGGWNPVLPPTTEYAPRANVVLHLVTNSLPHTQSGYTQRTHSLLLEQTKAGLEAHAVTRLGYPQSLDSTLAQKIDFVDGIKYHRLVLPGQRGNLRDHHQSEAEQLLELVRRIRPAVLHTTTHFVNGLVAREVASSVGIPWIYEIRGQLSDTWASHRGPEAIKSERYQHFKRMELDVAHSAQGLITIGRNMRSKLIKRGLDPDKIQLSPNAVGEGYLKHPVGAVEARMALGLEASPTYIGTVSSLVGYEGLETLLEAFSFIKERKQDVRLLIVGDGEAMHALKRKCQELGLDASEIFVGRVSRTESVTYHQALDVFVVPRRDQIVTQNVTPLKPVEAMAMSRPVVASDLPALREIVIDNENGFIFPAGDAKKLAETLEYLIDHPVERVRLGENGRSMVLNERTWQESVKASLRWYRRLTTHFDNFEQEVNGN